MTKNIFSTFKLASIGLSRVLANSVTIIYSIIFLRFGNVSVQEYGEAIYVMYLLGIISTLSALGMTEGIQKYVNKVNPKKVIGPAVVIEFVVLILISILILLFDPEFKISKSHPLLFCLALLTSVFNLLVLVFNGLHQQLRSSFYQILFVISLLSLIIFCFFSLKMDILTTLLSSVAITWGGLSLIILLDLKFQKQLDLLAKPNQHFLKFSLNTFIYILCFQILTQTDVLFINFFLGDVQTGVYKSVTQSALIPRIFGLTVGTPLLPIFSRLFHQENYLKAFSILQKSLIVLWVCISILFLGSWFFGQWFLNTLYDKPEITGAGSQILPILILAFGIQTINTPMIMYFQAKGQESLVRNFSLVQAILFVAGMTLMTSHGLIYSALTLLFVEVLSLPYYYFHFWQDKKAKNTLFTSLT